MNVRAFGLSLAVATSRPRPTADVLTTGRRASLGCSYFSQNIALDEDAQHAAAIPSDTHKPGMSAESLFDSYPDWGDDPSIPVIGGVDPPVRFSAWKYANERCREICGDAPIGP